MLRSLRACLLGSASKHTSDSNPNVHKRCSEAIDECAQDVFGCSSQVTNALAASLCNFYKSLLYELNCSSHCIQIDFYPAEQVRISPVIYLGCCAAELDLYTAFH